MGFVSSLFHISRLRTNCLLRCPPGSKIRPDCSDPQWAAWATAGNTRWDPHSAGEGGCEPQVATSCWQREQPSVLGRSEGPPTQLASSVEAAVRFHSGDAASHQSPRQQDILDFIPTDGILVCAAVFKVRRLTANCCPLAPPILLCSRLSNPNPGDMSGRMLTPGGSTWPRAGHW